MARSETRESILPPLWILILGAAAVVVWLMFALKEILVLFVVGYSIAYAIDPTLRWLSRRGVSRTFGVFLIFGFALVLMTLLVLTAIPTIADEFNNLSHNMPSYLETVKNKLLPLYDQVKAYLPEKFRVPIASGVPTTTSEGAPEAPLPTNALELIPVLGAGVIPKVTSAVFKTLLSGYSITLTLINLALLPFIVFYLAVDFSDIHRRALSFFPVPQRKKISEIAAEIDGYVGSFVRGQFLVGCILFILYVIGLGGVVGIKLWFLLAVISGFGNLVPYLGFLCGIVLASIMALVTFGDFWHVVQVWIVYAVVQFLEGFFITPKIVGGSVGLSPLAVIVAIFAGGQIFGLLGVFLAIPGAAALRVLLNHSHQWVLKRGC